MGNFTIKYGDKMNIKLISIFLVIFFLVLSAVSAAGENITVEDNILAIDETNDELTVFKWDNVSVADEVDDNLAVSNENNVSVTVDNSVSVSDSDNLSISGGVEPLTISNVENLSVANNDNLPVAVSVQSKLSVPVEESKLSMEINPENSKLGSIYNKVYSTKKWKTVGVVVLKLKSSWSKYKINKVTNKIKKIANKRTKSIMKKYVKKGWHYDRIFYTYNYGRYVATFKYYIQFYKTVYYNGYGEVLLVR